MILTQNKNITYLLKKATKTCGIESQLRLLQEECGECVAAVNRFFRGCENARENLASEVQMYYLCLCK